uniref:3CxxC-type domain-containing protein n=1 Tax=Gopherus agassizii TaxID=38772 RepID=A0A452IWU7_9SAUR
GNVERWTQRQIFSQKIGQMKPGDRWTLKADYNLQSNDLDPGWKQFLQQHAFARVDSCRKPFAQVNILFHVHLDRKQRQGQVKMKIFRQECKKCLVPKLELPEFSQENVERVLENLMLKIRGKCYREAINPHDLSKIIVEAQTMGPHDSSHCDAGWASPPPPPRGQRSPGHTVLSPGHQPKLSPHRLWGRGGARMGLRVERGGSHSLGKGRLSLPWPMIPAAHAPR